jgi:hypothetical protein
MIPLVRHVKHRGLANAKEHQKNMARGGKPKPEITGGWGRYVFLK